MAQYRNFLALSLIVVSLGLLGTGCSTTKKDPNQPQPSDDILELLTGFGESISQRDYQRAVGYLTPEDRSLILNANGKVPEDKQRALSALPLQRLIRSQGVRVEGGYLAGIYDRLPVLRPIDELATQSESSSETPSGIENGREDESQTLGQSATGGYEDLLDGKEAPELAEMELPQVSPEEAQLKAAVRDFFQALNQGKYQDALSLVNENERSIFLDDKGRLKNSAKQRLEKIDQRTSSRDALLLRDGKITGVTLLLPPE
jgi:hypothetical protein